MGAYQIRIGQTYTHKVLTTHSVEVVSLTDTEVFLQNTKGEITSLTTLEFRHQYKRRYK